MRLTEAITLFNSLLSGEVELERHEGFSITSLGYFRGTKLAYYGFISDYLKNYQRSKKASIIQEG